MSAPPRPGPPEGGVGEGREKRGGWLGRWYVRLSLSALVLAAWLALVDISWQSLAAALERVSTASFAAAMFWTLANLLLGAVRWQCLLSAFGAARPPLVPTVHAYLVAFFFNTFVPGNLAGDVLRAGAAARQFRTPSVPFFLIGLERLLGLSGVFLLAGGLALATSALGAAVGAGIVGAGMVFAALALSASRGLRFGWRWLPARWARLRALGELPPVRSLGWFAVVLVLSLGTQALFSLGAVSLVLAVAGDADVGGVVSVVPLALLAIYLPTFAGFGTREAAFAFALGRYGVNESQATAASLAFGVAQLAVAALGGAAHGLRRTG